MAMNTIGLVCLAAAAGALTADSTMAQDQATWRPVPGRIATRWADQVSPDNALPEYPRPQFTRERWANLNGLWQYAIRPSDAGGAAPANWDGDILVPFALETSLSGVGRVLEPDQTLWYRRTFEVPADWRGQGDGAPRIILHFGAVDWAADVWVNDTLVGGHVGGYDPFSFDITRALKEGSNTITVAVRDPTDTGGQPRGKQVREPEGIFYRRTSGIWQTVWMEPVPQEGWIERVSYVPNAAEGWVEVSARLEGQGECQVEIRDGDRVVGRGVTDHGRVRIKIDNPRLWSPDDPFLYDVMLRTFAAGAEKAAPLDEVESYVALRDIAVGPDAHGVQRLLLNGEPLFHFGPLDQGFWPESLYTPPADEALRFDVEAVKKMGGNMLRKHVKVEPSRFYYWCDKLGVMVWQDMPSPFFRTDRGPDHQPVISEQWKKQFELEHAELVRDFFNHPSIVMWVPFNEGWGQNDLNWSREMTEKVKQWDPTRLVNCASGWTDTGVGDVIDHHIYPGPGTPKREASRAAVLGEFGGLGLPISGHTWLDEANWGYVTYKNQEELNDAYIALIDKLPMLIAQGLAAAVYTQTSDVEIEVNGWLTYDREIWKIDPARAAEATRAVYGPPPHLTTVVECAIDADGEDAPQWRYTTDEPADGWQQPGFDDAGWKTGRAGFGARGTPGAIVGTDWRSSDIWLRRTVTLTADQLKALRAGKPHLAIHHDEDAQVYLNGVRAASFTNWTTAYTFAPIAPEAAATLKEGENIIAIHCHQTNGGQYIDAGLVTIEP